MNHSFFSLNQTGRKFAVLCAAACLLTAAALGAPNVSLSKVTGPPTTALTVSGTAFGASHLIDLYFDTGDVALVVSSPTGTFSQIALQVPAAAVPGTHWVTAVVRVSGLAAQTSFLVQTDWTEFGFTPKGKRNNPYENVLNPSTVGSIDLDWTFTNQPEGRRRLSRDTFRIRGRKGK